MRFAGNNLLLAVSLTGLASCTYDWERLDPRLGPSGGGGSGGSGGHAGSGASAGGGGTSGGGGTGGSGGATGGGSLGPFGPPQLVASLSHLEDDDDPTFTADLLELYYNSHRGGAGGDIWKSARDSPNDPWGAPVEVTELNTPVTDTNPTITADGLTIWLSSNRDVEANPDVFVSSRPDRQSPWSTPTAVAWINTPDWETVDAVRPDGLMAIITSDRTGGEGLDDLYVSTRSSTAAAWEPLTAIAELNTSFGDEQAWLDPQGSTLYFDSNRGLDDYDIYVATRPTTSSVWGVAVPVAELNTAEADTDPCLSPDMRYIMFVRGPSDEREIYEAFR